MNGGPAHLHVVGRSSSHLRNWGPPETFKKTSLLPGQLEKKVLSRLISPVEYFASREVLTVKWKLGPGSRWIVLCVSSLSFMFREISSRINEVR